MKKMLYNLVLVLVLMAAPMLYGKTTHAAAITYYEVQAKNVTELRSALTEARKNANVAKPYKVILTGDTYEVNECLAVYSNTVLEMNHATVQYDAKDYYAIYIAPGTSNVAIKDGKLVKGGIYVNAAKGVSIEGVTIENAPENGIYAKGGAKLSSIENCEISTAKCGIYCKGVEVGRLSKNKIQNVDTFGIDISEESKVIDLTENEVDTFGNSDTTFGILISDKNTKVDNVCYNQVSNGKTTGIMLTLNARAGQITYNTVERCTGDGIGIYNGAICGPLNYNTITEIGGIRNGGDGDYGINIDSVRNGYGATYVSEVIGNKISKVTYAGIAVYAGNKESFGTCYVTGNISNNVVKECGTYKHSKDWKEEKKKGCQSGIYVDQYGLVKGNINNNTVSDMAEHGIYVHEWGQVDGSIYNNTVSNTEEVGIELYKGIVKKNIYNNKVTNAGTKGIAVETSSKVYGNIYSNTLTNQGAHGIYVANNSSVNVVTKNIVTNPTESGIYVGNKSVIKSITENTITNPKLTGVQISEGCYAEEISKNKFTRCGTYGVRVLGAQKKLNIISNTITITGSSQPIQVAAGASTNVAIKNNTLAGTKKNYGIRLLSGKVVISGNKISGSTYPICIDSTKLVSGTVSENVFSQNKNNTIKIASAKVDHKAPALSNVKAVKGKIMNVSWKKQDKATTYEVYRSNSKTSGFKKVATVKATSFKNTKLVAKKNYYYKLRSLKKIGNITVYSEYSQVKGTKAIA